MPVIYAINQKELGVTVNNSIAIAVLICNQQLRIAACVLTIEQ